MFITRQLAGMAATGFSLKYVLIGLAAVVAVGAVYGEVKEYVGRSEGRDLGRKEERQVCDTEKQLALDGARETYKIRAENLRTQIKALEEEHRRDRENYDELVTDLQSKAQASKSKHVCWAPALKKRIMR